jgi:hypothetical protein
MTMKTITGYQEILKEKKKPSPRQTSLLDFFNSSSASHALPSVLFNTGNDNPCDLPTVKENVPAPSTAICWSDFISNIYIYIYIYIYTHTYIYIYILYIYIQS